MKNYFENIISKVPPEDLKKQFSDFACVAVILRGDCFENLELAFIRRAHNPQDAWSGQIAFPGGRYDQGDESDYATAVRETFEEVGWELCLENHLGFLTDVQARHRAGMLGFFLRPVVFYIENNFSTQKLDPLEVDDVFWVPVSHLLDHQHQTTFHLPDRELTLPGVRLPQGDTLWGLTYMMTQELLEKLRQAK